MLQSELGNISEREPGEDDSGSEGRRPPGMCPGCEPRGLVFQVLPGSRDTQRKEMAGGGKGVEQDKIRERS